MSGKCCATLRKCAIWYSKPCFYEFKQPEECPIPNIRGIKPDKSEKWLEKRFPNSYIWDTIGLVL